MNRLLNSALLSRCFLCICLIGVVGHAYAQKDPIERLWYNGPKTAKILIYKSRDKKFYGMITWLKEPSENGHEKLDKKNPDRSKRTQPLLSLLVLKDFVKRGDYEYTDGTIYDPKKGNTYSCTMNLRNDELRVHGYIGISLIGRTEIWTKAD